jgi:hypothetical protein
MMSARNERIRAFGVSRGACPFVFLIFPLRDNVCHRQTASDRRERARFFLGFLGSWFVSGDYLLEGLGWLAERVLSVGFVWISKHFGGLGYLTLGLIHETILLSDRANVSTEKGQKNVSKERRSKG